MLHLVGVLGSVAVDALHAAAFGRVVDADLGRVDVVVGSVEEGDDNLRGNAFHQGNEVVGFVDGSRSQSVLVKIAHGPAEGTLGLSQVGVVAIPGIPEELLVLGVRIFGGDSDGTLLAIHRRVNGDGLDIIATAVGAVVAASRDGYRGHIGVRLGVGLDDSVVGNLGLQVLGTLRRGALEEERSINHHPGLEGVVPLDDAGMDVGDEEQSSEEGKTKADTERDRGNVPWRLLVETQSRRALVDNGEGANGASNEEEARRGPDSPRERVLAHVDRDLDEHEDDGGKAGRDEGSHAETGEDGTEAGPSTPTPLYLAGADGSNTHTGDGGHEGVGRRHVGRVARAPHNPRGSTGRGTGKGEELHTGIASEGVAGDDAVLDGGSRSCAHSEGTRQFEDGTEHHGLSVRDGPRRDTGGPGIGHIV